LGIGSVAFENFHRYGASFGIGKQSEDDLRLAAFVVARMAEVSEIAMAAFEVCGGEVVKNQAAFGEVAFGDSVFDIVLTRQ
jgi:hypothetical protein